MASANAAGSALEADDRSGIQLRGLPFDATVDEVREFLGEHADKLVGKDSIKLLQNNRGRATGLAEVLFTSAEAAETCRKQLDRKSMKDRYIEFLDLKPPKKKRSRDGSPDAKDQFETALLRGLPFQATAEDVRAFLGEHAADLGGEVPVELLQDARGRPSGYARLTFVSSEAAKTCRRKLHNTSLQDRYIEFLDGNAHGPDPDLPSGRDRAPQHSDTGFTAAKEHVLQECRNEMFPIAKRKQLLSTLGAALTQHARNYLKNVGQGLRHFLSEFSNEFAVDGEKGKEYVSFIPQAAPLHVTYPPLHPPHYPLPHYPPPHFAHHPCGHHYPPPSVGYTYPPPPSFPHLPQPNFAHPPAFHPHQAFPPAPSSGHACHHGALPFHEPEQPVLLPTPAASSPKRPRSRRRSETSSDYEDDFREKRSKRSAESAKLREELSASHMETAKLREELEESQRRNQELQAALAAAKAQEEQQRRLAAEEHKALQEQLASVQQQLRKIQGDSGIQKQLEDTRRRNEELQAAADATTQLFSSQIQELKQGMARLQSQRHASEDSPTQQPATQMRSQGDNHESFVLGQDAPPAKRLKLKDR
eukprot:TRINITY_DN92039_c0_g1_i1.p1 TRINITY_DN92039_c0_g1~~TRINITY_DN92039_c0_g1_i1.p1  ORF type:complete len:589 (+),score=125.62 TRINITY_DN92039_c0_g1_i1:59-1825(+)